MNASQSSDRPMEPVVGPHVHEFNEGACTHCGVPEDTSADPDVKDAAAALMRLFHQSFHTASRAGRNRVIADWATVYRRINNGTLPGEPLPYAGDVKDPTDAPAPDQQSTAATRVEKVLSKHLFTSKRATQSGPNAIWSACDGCDWRGPDRGEAAHRRHLALLIAEALR